MTNTSQKPQFEYGMNEHLKNLLTEIKTCAFSVLMDKGYTKDKAEKAIENIKNFNVYGIETGFRVETLVDEYKIEIFYHEYKTINKNLKYATATMYSKEPKTTTKTVTIQDENDALNQGRIVSAFELQTNDRLEKLETQLSNLQTLIDDTRKSQHDLKESINLINRKFKWIGENLIAE